MASSEHKTDNSAKINALKAELDVLTNLLQKHKSVASHITEPLKKKSKCGTQLNCKPSTISRNFNPYNSSYNGPYIRSKPSYINRSKLSNTSNLSSVSNKHSTVKNASKYSLQNFCTATGSSDALIHLKQDIIRLNNVFPPNNMPCIVQKQTVYKVSRNSTVNQKLAFPNLSSDYIPIHDPSKQKFQYLKAECKHKLNAAGTVKLIKNNTMPISIENLKKVNILETKKEKPVVSEKSKVKVSFCTNQNIGSKSTEILLAEKENATCSNLSEVTYHNTSLTKLDGKIADENFKNEFNKVDILAESTSLVQLCELPSSVPVHTCAKQLSDIAVAQSENLSDLQNSNFKNVICPNSVSSNWKKKNRILSEIPITKTTMHSINAKYVKYAAKSGKFQKNVKHLLFSPKSDLASIYQKYKYIRMKAIASGNKRLNCSSSLQKQSKILNSKYKVVNKSNIKKVNPKMALSQLNSSTVEKSPKLNSCGIQIIQSYAPSHVSAVKKTMLNKNTKSSSGGNSKRKLNTKYKVVNKACLHNTVKNSSILNSKLAKNPSGKNIVIQASVKKRKSLNKNGLSSSSGTLDDKISKLKFIRSSEYEGYDLTELPTAEITSIEKDPKVLFKLSKLLKTPSCSLPSNSKVKLKCTIKRENSINHVVRMIKTKYQIVNKKNSQRKLSYQKVIKYNRSQKAFSGNSWKSCTGRHFVLRNNLLKEWKVAACKSSSPRKQLKKTRFVKIGDIPYRVSSSKMTRTYRKYPKQLKKVNIKNSPTVFAIRGIKFEMDPSGKSLRKLPASTGFSDEKHLKRIDIGGKTYVKTDKGIFIQSPSSQIRGLASRVLNRSIQTVWAASAKKSTRKSNSFCMFYNRFGRCNRGNNCPYVHDPSKIAICTRFLKGTCKIKDCPFSHKLTPSKIAICSYFLQGSCTNENCAFRHDKVEPGTTLCLAFVRGYCSNGSECKKAHILTCPDYLQGSCTNKDCPYPHPPQKRKKNMNEDNDADNLRNGKSTRINIQDSITDNPNKDEEMRYFTHKSLINETPKLNNCEKQNFNNEIKKNCNKPKKSRKLSVLPDYLPLSLDMDSQ